ncbi:hypothetical protein AMES_0375 [Amycolatopsis mediterranei S699]|uniref:Uncharacterized protein n=3 Tax=Amycolatopsis mediterranei TaxID=33910 RepID=A0A0H3CU85_AMYMU|nr:hypothetical protein [Amycolatopsis mediterranei]ABX56686.1 pMEA-specific protein [Amycolatopsis mediterranei]ADJ42197.1 hypothetical protein AMED_0375 [Amycolatopsis mediterranei U32]AEK38875.1 hypothetical protein RAM_01915 [Amycolatopsis mediterranei S699]AFO73911.1 hypothetical protein AMES_0375 [Amycolatopsis mediterranei S699]AGT81040.1 hypothetical protein B737_0376 [Amycolatopsis mediterranei RB]
MAKNNGGLIIPTSKRGGLLKGALVILGIGALVLVIKHPVDAASMTTAAVSGIGDAFDSVATFLRSLH